MLEPLLNNNTRMRFSEYARFEGSQAADTRPVSPAGLRLRPGAVPAVLRQVVQGRQGVLQVHALPGAQDASVSSRGSERGCKSEGCMTS